MYVCFENIFESCKSCNRDSLKKHTICFNGRCYGRRLGDKLGYFSLKLSNVFGDIMKHVVAPIAELLKFRLYAFHGIFGGYG